MSHNSKNSVFILHCEHADPDQHWYAWLEQQLQSDELVVKRIFLADASHPEPGIWQTCLETQLKELNEHSIVVAHGLSCIALARFLANKLKQMSIKAGIFIAAFYDPVAQHPEFDGFIRQSHFESGLVRVNIQRRLVFFSSNDPVIPVPLTFKFANLLNAQLIEVAQAGHFRAEEGFKTFPQLLQALQALLKAELS
ncbi:RBBP9/YdeN family alpha/beta hydrolase [Acinetobacter sp. A47]|uniref:RBBP9/YdeN family alpha/beta hydrolase n=1 Tax=Acinetobacter sp. A47 TaxID=1561217 RepID=UPI00057014F6|nr:alpha/beta hydrolase [Acinetobacter sp. A47]